ncbi:oligosaccharide flippase family protein [Pseudalkalibacillus sp. SCS-8]|uniref:oligosaccharide flippase family protein n=1 Tax=Pseudalkalibacillus nanhaiensis TaxID=3115291 RepID=UPI0032DADD06
MLSRLVKNTFFKNSILYTLGSMITPLIGFIMLPVYTYYLSPAEYGIMTTVQTLIGLFELILLLSLHVAVTRYYYDFLEEPQKQKEYLGTIFIFVLGFSSILSLLFLFFSKSIGGILFNNIPIYPFFFYLVGLAWLSALFALPLTFIRAQEKAGLFVLINIIKSILVVLLTFFFLVKLDLGAESALLSQLIITFFMVLIVFYSQIKHIKLTFNLVFLKSSLFFSLPLLPHAASGWIINASDRIILEKYVIHAQLGIYALAAQISMVLGMFYISVNSALIPRYMRLRKEGNEKSAKNMLKAFAYVVIIFGVLAIPIAIYATKKLTSPEFHEAVEIIPILLLSQIVNGFYYIAVAKLFYHKKTKSIATSSTISALVNLIINILFIPKIGIWGAVYSTIIAEIVRFISIYISGKKV